MQEEVRTRLLISINQGRLAVLCGAGLSMGPPTNLPSAVALTDRCIRKYEAITGVTVLPDLRGDLEAFSRHLFERDEFTSPFLQGIVPWDRHFQRHPNPGHWAIADFLLCDAIVAAISTNYDSHIEDAAFELGEEDLQPCLDGREVNAVARNYRPLLKIHGCHRRSRVETVWLPEQLEEEPIRGRIESSSHWMRGNLEGRDLLFIGFWTDWEYLNTVLERTVGGITPQSVIVVDPSDLEDLKAKAPGLWRWLSESKVQFWHERVKGEVFLDEFRKAVSEQYLRALLENALEHYKELTGKEYSGDRLDLSAHSTDDLYSLRRDLSGAAPNRPVRSRQVEGLEEVGAILMRILDLGGEVIGPRFLFKGETVRVLTRPGKHISRIQAEIEGENPVSAPVDRVVCVGAIRDQAVRHIIRAEEESTVVRPHPDSNWTTSDEFSPNLEWVR